MSLRARATVFSQKRRPGRAQVDCVSGSGIIKDLHTEAADYTEVTRSTSSTVGRTQGTGPVDSAVRVEDGPKYELRASHTLISMVNALPLAY